MKTVPEVWLGDAGIVHVRFPDNSHINLESVKWANQRHRELCGERRAVLVYADSVASADYDAQRHASSEEVREMICCMAIVVRCVFTRAMADLFMRFHKPPYPTQIFNDETEAMEWLLNERRETACVPPEQV